MPTTVTKTVKPGGGGDFASLSSWESTTNADLTVSDTIQQAECYGGTADTTGFIINGWTTDPTRYIRIYTPTTERHVGVWDVNKFRLSVAAASTIALDIREEYTRIEGIQVENTHATAARGGIVCTCSGGATSDVRVDSCIVRNCGSDSAGTRNSIISLGGTITIRNTSVYGNVTQPGVSCATSTSTAAVNCDNVTSAGHATFGFQRGSGTMTLRNCYSGGNGTDAYSGTITRTTCMHDTASVFAGSTASKAYDTSNFTNVTAGSIDHHLVGGSALIGQGTDLSGTFTVDIDGDTRTAPWDIGCDQRVASGFQFPFIRRLQVMKHASLLARM